VRLATYLHLVLRLKMIGVITLLPLFAFMVCNGATLLGTFAKLWNLTISFVTSVQLSVRMKQLSSCWVDCHEILYLRNLKKKTSRKCKFNLNWTRITSILYDDPYTFFITSCSVILRIKSISDKSCRGNQNTFCVQ